MAIPPSSTPPAEPNADDLWRAIQHAGGLDGYVTAQLTQRGLLAQRRDASQMKGAELDAYKKSLKAEAAERRKIQKEAWRAYKATHIVHLGEGIYWNDRPPAKEGEGAAGAPAGDKWDVAHAEERAAENELPPLDTPQQLASRLGLSIGQLRWLAYHREAATRIHYYRFTIPKRNGSPRPIWAPMRRLKAAQHWVLRHVVEKLLVHGSAHGFLPGRSILSNAQVHTDARAVVKMDLAQFFPTVTFPRVKGIFRKAGYREQVATLLALLCTEAPREVVEDGGTTYFVALGPRCLPQGAPTSPALTNTLCLKLDQRLTGLAAKLGWRYTRYADDLTFSLPRGHAGKPRLGALLGLARRVVEGEGFKLNPEKTRVARAGGRQRVTGLVVNGHGSPRVPRQLRRQIRAALHNLRAGRPLKAGQTLDRLAGYAAFIHMGDPRRGGEMLQQAHALRDTARMAEAVIAGDVPPGGRDEE